MTPEMSPTHRLECERFSEGFGSLVEMTRPSVTAAVVRVREEEAESPPADGEVCRRTWDSVRPHLERLPEEDGSTSTVWRCPTETEREALLDLIELTDGGAGAYFVYQVELRKGGKPVVEAVPHHMTASVDAEALEKAGPNEVVGIEEVNACLVPIEPQIEWVAEERRWKVAGGSLCVETVGGRKSSCYGLTNLREADIDGKVVKLSWEMRGTPGGIVSKTLSWVMSSLYNPPTSVPCGTRSRAEEFKQTAQDILEAYDGREV